MSTAKRHIFRAQALQHYAQSRDKDVLPRFVSPPVFLFLWIVLGLCLAAGWLAWSIRIPIYTAGVGMVTGGSTDRHSTAILFASPDQLHTIHPGQSVQLSIGSNNPSFKSTITSVRSTLLSPTEAREQYQLDGSLALLVTQPSVVLIVTFDANFSTVHFEGSVVRAEIQIGTQRVLSTVPILGQMIGE